MELQQNIEGVLFYKAAPMNKKSLMKIFDVSGETLDASLCLLQERLESGATRLVLTNEEVSLCTAPELHALIESLRKDEMKKDIGKAGAETLAIILYKGPITRSEVDRVRGVNSSYIIRNLLVRGLIEKKQAEKSIMFQATTTLLSLLGITDKTKLQDFETVMNALETYEKEREEEM